MQKNFVDTVYIISPGFTLVAVIRGGKETDSIFRPRESLVCHPLTFEHNNFSKIMRLIFVKFGMEQIRGREKNCRIHGHSGA